MILLIGATGKVGGEAARALLARGVKPRVLVRSAEKAAPLAAAGAELVVGDALDKASVARALEGSDKLFLLLPNGEQQLDQEKQIVDLAAAAGVRHIVKLSSMESLPDATAPIPQIHWASEEYIRASGVAWTMIRPNFYMQNFLGSAASIREKKLFSLPMGDGKTAMADTRDIGAVVAEVLTGEGHEGKSYDITGPEVLDFHQVAERFSAVLGTPISYVAADPAVYLGILKRVLPNEWHANAVSTLFGEIAEGLVLPKRTDTFRELMGREPIALEQFIGDHIDLFR